MPTIICRICWMDKYDGTGELQCVHMQWPEKYGGEMWNFTPCKDGIIRGYVMLKAKNKDGSYSGTININTLTAQTRDKSIEGVNVIFFAMNPKDKTNYIVGHYENAKVYRKWKNYPVKKGKARTYSFEAHSKDVFLIPEEKRNIQIISSRSKEALSKGGKFPGQSDVFFGSSNISYTCELNEKLKLVKLECDVEEIENQKDITETEKQRLVSSRIGQGWYRKQLIKYWEKCPVSGCNEIALLKASHIKPWRVSNNEERLNVFNGFLLSPNIDTLFDKGYISFENDGMILMSTRISASNLIKLGVNTTTRISISTEHIPFLMWHRKNVFIN